MYLTIQRKGKVIRADYEGGPYIKLTFGSSRYAPVEVINVWDYEAGQSTIPVERNVVRDTVLQWMRDQDNERPEWYEEYLANASY